MADTRIKDDINIAENIFVAVLAYTFEFAIIYSMTTFLIFCGLYAYVWAIQAVGLLSILHLIAIPLAYYGVRKDFRIMVLLSLLFCCVWFILIIVYVVVFSVQKFNGNDFPYRSLHHIVLAVYAILDIVVVLMLSVDIISEKSHKSLRKSLNQSPETADQKVDQKAQIPTSPTIPATKEISTKKSTTGGLKT